MCVLDLFFRTLAVNSVSDFYFFIFFTVTCFDAMNKEALKLNTTASSFSSLIKASATTTLQNLATGIASLLYRSFYSVTWLARDRTQSRRVVHVRVQDGAIRGRNSRTCWHESDETDDEVGDDVTARDRRVRVTRHSCAKSHQHNKQPLCLLVPRKPSHDGLEIELQTS